jgi:ABC-2 type transport system ATP-binding protein
MTTVIRLSELRKTYPGTVAVDQLSFEVGYGTIHGFLGPNGAGKSTTMKALCGLIRPDSGSIEIYQDSKLIKRGETFRCLGFLPEQPPLYEHMRVREFLEFVFKVYSSDLRNTKKMVDIALERCGLVDVQRKFISQLSKGYRQRTGIAMAMVHGPSILILDEPFVGLDPIALGELRKVLLELKQDHTILFSSHQLDEVHRLCDHLTVIDQGRAVYNGTLDNFIHGKDQGIRLKALVLNFNQEIVKQLKKAHPEIKLVKQTDLGTNTELEFLIQRAEQKIELSQFFAGQMVPVLEFVELEKEMESLFQDSLSHSSNEFKVEEKKHV